MPYCDRWHLPGFAIGLAPFGLVVMLASFVERWPRRYRVCAILSGITTMAVPVITLPASLVLWNGLKPAICDRID